MPEEMGGSAVYQPCVHCGDLKLASAPLCPHCGARQSAGSAVAEAGIMFIKVIVALVVGLLVLPLGVCGACTMLVGMGSVATNGVGSLQFALLGAGLLALAAGGIALILAMFGVFKKGASRR